MKITFWGVGTGLLLFCIGEIYCFFGFQRDPFVPKPLAFFDYMQSYLFLYLIYVIAIIIIQWNAYSFINYFHKMRHTNLENYFIIVCYVVFTILIPSYIVFRLVYFSFDFEVYIYLINSITYFFACVITFIRRKVFFDEPFFKWKLTKIKTMLA